LQDKSPIELPPARKDKGDITKEPEVRPVITPDMRTVLGEKEKLPEQERLEKAAEGATRKDKTTNVLLNILGDMGADLEEADKAEEAKRADEAEKAEEAKKVEERKKAKKVEEEKKAEKVKKAEEAKRVEEAKLPKRPTIEKFTFEEED
jgi:hypothetical protein